MSDTVRIISVIHGAICSVVVFALLLLLVLGEQSPLGFEILILFLAPFWSGVPLLLLSSYSLKAKKDPAWKVRLAALLTSMLPPAAYIVYQFANMLSSGAGLALEGIATLALVFLPTWISLALYVPIMRAGKPLESA